MLFRESFSQRISALEPAKPVYSSPAPSHESLTQSSLSFNPALAHKGRFMRIFVTGSIAFDYIMVFPGRFRDHILPEKMHVLSVSFLVDSLTRLRGGTGANIAYNLGLLGERPLLVGSVGEDFAESRAWLEAHGVDC